MTPHVPIWLHSLDGKQGMNACVALGSERAEALEHGKIYPLDDLQACWWLQPVKKNPVPKKAICIKGGYPYDKYNLTVPPYPA